jgi:hypothetical protein
MTMSWEEAAEWAPSYSPWRHGGWYVDNVRYPGGAVGCVSNNFEDKRWRIVCADDGITFPSRDAAARAEKVLADYQCSVAPKCATCGYAYDRGGCTRGACPDGRPAVDWPERPALVIEEYGTEDQPTVVLDGRTAHVFGWVRVTDLAAMDAEADGAYIAAVKGRTA